MIYKIDDKVCERNNITLPELFFLLSLRAGGKIGQLKVSFIEKGIMEQKEGKLKVASSWAKIADRILNKDTDLEHLTSLANKMREVYPPIKMPGTPLYYRGNTSEIIKKLQKFFEKYEDNNFTDEEIVKATQRFVNSFNGNYRYLPLLKYFISKFKPVEEEDGTKHNVEYSSLLDYLQNPDAENQQRGEDWTITMI